MSIRLIASGVDVTKFPCRIFVALLASAAMGAASAHITLAEPSAQAGSDYTATFRVPHGCSGAATTAITVFLPADIREVRPESKNGWQMNVATEQTGTGHTVVNWNGGRLAGDAYDEFIVRMKLPEQPGTRWFRVLQQCEKGQNDWSEIPAEGQAKPQFPAPHLDITPAAGQAG